MTVFVFMLNFKVPFSKGFSHWGLRASCTLSINLTTIIELKEGQEKLKEANEIALICRKATDMPLELVPHSSASTPGFVTLLQQVVMGYFADGPHLSQASEISFPTRPTMRYLEFIWLVNFSPQNKVPKCRPVLGSLYSLGHNFCLAGPIVAKLHFFETRHPELSNKPKIIEFS